MFRSIVIAATAASFAVVAVPAPAHAQTVGNLGACNPTTGLGPNGRPCKALVPLSNDRIEAGDRIQNVPTLDRSRLAETFDCRDVDATGGFGGAAVAYVEDCGTAAPAQLSNIQPYAGELVAAPSPPPVATLPPPPPVAALPPPPPAAIPPAPPVFTAVPAAAPAFAGISNAALFGAAAVVGLGAVAIAAASGGGSSTPSTN